MIVQLTKLMEDPQYLENAGHAPCLCWTRVTTEFAILVGQFWQRTPRRLLHFDKVTRENRFYLTNRSLQLAQSAHFRSEV